MNPALACRDDGERRALTRRSPLNGFDFLEVTGPERRELRVFFLGKAPERTITAAELRIEGGRRLRDLQVVGVELLRQEREDADDCLRVLVDRSGDSSTYRLRVVALDERGQATDRPADDFDPRYDGVDFSFVASCPSDLDCATDAACETPVPAEPVIDYLARDYASLRRLLLDRLALLMPEWRERHVPDIGITLVELLAYVGDQMAYHQDAVATEAYLDTCRLRISLRRHLRLVDYRLHEGCNARAWLCLKISQPHRRIDLRSFQVVALPARAKATDPLDDEALASLEPQPTLFFEPVVQGEEAHRDLYRDHETLRFHTWGGTECCLEAGATAATLLEPEGSFGEQDARRLHLTPGEVLVFEEVLGPRSGAPADADPAHRHAVRLTKADPAVDPLTGQRLVEIAWCAADALPFPLCLSTTTDAPDCRRIDDVSVARGNVILVDHGRGVADDLGAVPTAGTQARCEDPCHGAEETRTPGRYRPVLTRPEVTHAQPPSTDCADASCPGGAAAAAMRQDARAAIAQVVLDAYPAAPDGTPAFGPADVADPAPLAHAIAAAEGQTASPAGWLRSLLAPRDLRALAQWDADAEDPPLPAALRQRLVDLLASRVQRWLPRVDLLASGPDDRHFVVEIDDDRVAHLRFGDGDCGERPAAGTQFHAQYRVGNGPAGQVGAERLTQIVYRGTPPSGLAMTARNPMPATGAVAQEVADDARLRGPSQLHARLERAITPADYAAIVMRDFAAEVQRAAAVLRWDGVGAVMQVAVDALGRSAASDDLLQRIAHHLQRYRRIGHVVQVVSARRVPLLVALHVCVKPGYLRAHVQAALREALGAGRLPGGRLGFFNPDALTLGAPVALSRIVAAAQAVAGVDSLQVLRLERLGDGPQGELDSGLLTVGPMEVAQLDHDPDFPENGQLQMTLEGGR